MIKDTVGKEEEHRDSVPCRPWTRPLRDGQPQRGTVDATCS